MKETIALIDKIIEEHEIITGKVHTLEQVASDAEAIGELKKAKEIFMPGRFGQESRLQKLQELLETIAEGLQAHFNREETGLLLAFEKYGDKELASALHFLLCEHEDLRNRFAHLRKLVAELAGGRLSRQVWEATAYDMRAYASHTRKLLEVHAETEEKLLRKLRSQLMGRGEEK